MTAALFLGEDVGFRLELGVRLDRAGLAQHLAALDFLALGATQQAADVVAGLALVEQLAEHLDAGDDRLLRRLDADDLDFLADLDDAALDAAGAHGAAAGDREHVFHRHQERFVLRTVRLGNGLVHRLHQRQDRFLAELFVLALERHQRRALDHRNLVAGEIILGQQFANLELDQFEQFGIVHHVHLVHVDDERRHADLAGEQDVLAGLRHRAVGGGHHQDGAVHLRRAGDHVLHVVGVAGAIDMRVVALLGRVFDVRRRNGDAARLFFRRLVDLVIGGEDGAAGLRQYLGDRRRQRRLAVVDVTDRTDIAMRLVAQEFFFGHGPLRSESSGCDRHANFFCTSADTLAGSSA